MKLTWIGHSCFRLESGEASVIIDPYAAGTVPGLNPVEETADAVFCTHEHADHSGRDQVTLTGKPCNLTITEIKSFHDDVKGRMRGSNTIFILDDGKTKVAHFGDIGCELEPEQMAQLSGLDVALVPVGGFFTIDGKRAAKLVKALNPKVVIPMHYRMKNIGYPVISTVEKFTRCMEPVTVTESSVYDTEDGLSGTVVLTPRNRS